MFATEELDDSERLSRFMPSSPTPGVLLPQTEYYDFAATDQAGNSWRAERQSIKEIFGVGNEIHSQLRRLEKVEEFGKPKSVSSQRWFIPGGFELPWHIQTTTERRTSVDRFEFDDESFAWAVRKEDKGLEVALTVKEGQLEPHSMRFLRSLGMLVGQILEPLVSYRVEGGMLVTRIHPPVSKAPIRLTGPMELRLYQHEDAHRFLSCCLGHADLEHPDEVDQLLILYRFWHRIAHAQSSDIENSSLVLSVAIEGILKTLFHSEHDADVEFAQHLLAAKPAIEKLCVHDRVRASVTRSLENAVLPKPKDTLQRLVVQGVLTTAHVEAWNKLRHAGAHGALLEDDDVKFQRHLDRYFCSLDLFYRLVFTAIGYRGECVDLSKSGWPKSVFPPVEPAADP